MKKLFKKLLLVSLGGIICLASFSSCTKDFSIIGKWGLVSWTASNLSGDSSRYDPLESGDYYEYLEFKADGTLIMTSLPDNIKKNGTYSYNDATREMSYRYDGDAHYYQATVFVVSPTEMTLTTDVSYGRWTQYFEKVK